MHKSSNSMYTRNLTDKSDAATFVVDLVTFAMEKNANAGVQPNGSVF